MAYTSIYRFASLSLWGNLPSEIQRMVSKFYASIYDRSFTKYIIKPYCLFNYKDRSYLDQFRSETGNNEYLSFQDFFTRVYKEVPKIKSNEIWPCEGLICDYGQVKDLAEINIKSDVRNVRTIFGKLGKDIPDSYFFSNVFLHNNNYHRIHMPTQGIIRDIERISGDLILLRPWVYKNDPSLPAMRNERINIKLETKDGSYWYLSIVGGPAVGSIVLNKKVVIGAELEIAAELGKFLLGSTCCMVTPLPSKNRIGDSVRMGDKY